LTNRVDGLVRFLRTTSISPGFVRTELADYIDDPERADD